jgi:hypothetical protein
MKTFQKITLAAAISAAPFASQALEALDDSVLAATTGQAGVTIEIDIAAAGVTIGEVEYIDQGSVLLQNINISNADIKQTIDVVTDGSLVMGTSAITDLTLNVGNVNGSTNTASAVALKSVAGAVTEVVNDIHLVADMGASSVTLVNLENATNATTYGINQTFDNGVDAASSAATGSLAIKMDASIDINELNVGLFGYTQAQAENKADLAGAKTTLTNALAAGHVVSYDSVGAATVADGSGADVSGTYSTEIGGVATAVGTADHYADASAIKLTNIQFYDKDAGNNRINATMDQTIWAQGGTVAQGGGVYIAMGNIKGTLDIGGIELGGVSIGRVKVSDINLAGMTQRIYGHP